MAGRFAEYFVVAGVPPYIPPPTPEKEGGDETKLPLDSNAESTEGAGKQELAEGTAVEAIKDQDETASQQCNETVNVITEDVDAVRDPELLFRFPRNDRDGSVLPPGMEYSLQPEGVVASLERRKPFSFSGVLTREEGSRVYFTAMSFDVYDEDRKRFYLQSIALVSLHQCFDSLRAYLGAIYKIICSGSEGQAALVPSIVHVLTAVPAPPKGLTRLSISLGPFLKPHDVVSPPVWSLAPPTTAVSLLFQLLDVQHVLMLYRIVLLEEKIVFVSASPARLTLAAEGLMQLLHPFVYEMAYIPIVHRHALPLFASPGYSIIGILASMLDEAQEEADDESEALIVFLDENRIEVKINTPIPEFPETEGTLLSDGLDLILHPHKATCSLTFGLDDVDLVEGFDGSYMDSHSWFRELSPTGEPISVGLQAATIRWLFMRFLISMIHMYPRYLVAVRTTPYPIISFNRAAFLYTYHRIHGDYSEQSKIASPFLLQLLNSQMFHQFIRRSSEANHVHTLFDDLVDAWNDNAFPSPKEVYEQSIAVNSTHVVDPPSVVASISSTLRFGYNPDLTSALDAEEVERCLQNKTSVSLSDLPSAPVVVGPVVYRHTEAESEGVDKAKIESGMVSINACTEALLGSEEKMMVWYLQSFESFMELIREEAFAFRLAESLHAMIKDLPRSRQLSAMRFEVLSRVVEAALSHNQGNPMGKTALDVDRVALRLLRVISKNYMAAENAKKYLYHQVAKYPIWTNTLFWESAFYRKAEVDVLALNKASSTVDLIKKLANTTRTREEMEQIQQKEDKLVNDRVCIIMNYEIQLGVVENVIRKFLEVAAHCVKMSRANLDQLRSILPSQLSQYHDLAVEVYRKHRQVSILPKHGLITDEDNDVVGSMLPFLLPSELLMETFGDIILFLPAQDQDDPSDRTARVAKGTLYLTNYRVIFKGVWHDPSLAIQNEHMRQLPADEGGAWNLEGAAGNRIKDDVFDGQDEKSEVQKDRHGAMIAHGLTDLVMQAVDDLDNEDVSGPPHGTVEDLKGEDEPVATVDSQCSEHDESQESNKVDDTAQKIDGDSSEQVSDSDGVVLQEGDKYDTITRNASVRLQVLAKQQYESIEVLHALPLAAITKVKWFQIPDTIQHPNCDWWDASGLCIKTRTFQTFRLTAAKEDIQTKLSKLQATISRIGPCFNNSASDTFAMFTSVSKRVENETRDKKNKAASALQSRARQISSNKPPKSQLGSDGSETSLTVQPVLQPIRDEPPAGPPPTPNLLAYIVDMNRMGIDFDENDKEDTDGVDRSPSPQWRLSRCNSDFLVCGTYPAFITVPKSLKDNEVAGMKGAFAGAHFPVLVWIDMDTGGSLLRAGHLKGKHAGGKRLLKMIAQLPVSTRASTTVSKRTSVCSMDAEVFQMDADTEDDSDNSDNDVGDAINGSSSNINKESAERGRNSPFPSEQSGSTPLRPISAKRSVSFEDGAVRLSQSDLQRRHFIITQDASALVNNNEEADEEEPGTQWEYLDVKTDEEDTKLPVRLIEVSKSSETLSNVTCRLADDQFLARYSAGMADFEDECFLQSVQDSQWLHQVGAILHWSSIVADLIQIKQATVIVSLEKGNNQTAQVTSLAQIYMDPFYRTLKGFEVLVKKEWLAFGYNFATRTGLKSGTLQHEFAPIFLQFLDCVYQLIEQYPSRFEFNSFFLETLAFHSTSMRFGTFLEDCERDRIKMADEVQLKSLWEFMLGCHSRSPQYFNFEYRPNEQPLRPLCKVSQLKIWSYLTDGWDRDVLTYDIPLSFTALGGTHAAFGAILEKPMSLLDPPTLAGSIEWDSPDIRWRSIWNSVIDRIPRSRSSFHGIRCMSEDSFLSLKTDRSTFGSLPNFSRGRSVRTKRELPQSLKMLMGSSEHYVHPHRFEQKKRSFKVCYFCGKKTTSAMICRDCGIACHERCHELVGPNCGQATPDSSVYIEENNPRSESPKPQQSNLRRFTSKLGRRQTRSNSINEETYDDPTAPQIPVTVNRGININKPRRYEGILYKVGFVRKTWRQRMFKLDRDAKVLKYYTPNGSDLKGEIALVEGTVVHSVDFYGMKKKKTPGVFIEIVTPSRTFVLRAVSEDEREEWVNALNDLTVGNLASDA